ncbi:MAG: hypothetical protein SGPRY_003366 [Prymnesium sp.]
MKRSPLSPPLAPRGGGVELIDLCDSPPSAPHLSKRRRLASLRLPHSSLAAVPTIDLSDEEQSDEDAQLAWRLQEEERVRADEELAFRLQDHEQQAARCATTYTTGRGMPPVPRGYPNGWMGVLGGTSHPRALHSYRDDSDARWLRGEAMMPPQMPGQFNPIGWPGMLGGGRAGNRLANLSMMDRDFGEADYEMLLSLDQDNR